MHIGENFQIIEVKCSDLSIYLSIFTSLTYLYITFPPIYIYIYIYIIYIYIYIYIKIDNKVIQVEGEIYWEVDTIAFRFYWTIISTMKEISSQKEEK